MTTTLTPAEVLDLPLPADEDNRWPDGLNTVRGFLVALLDRLWREQDRFSGKRPWGNSGWTGPIEIALIQAGAVQGSLDEDGYIEDVDERAVDRIVLEAIAALGVS